MNPTDPSDLAMQNILKAMQALEKAEQSLRDIEYQDRLKEYKGFLPKPDSLWLVIYECRPNVIKVSADGQGFFAPGQEPMWWFDCIDEWIQEIVPPAMKEKI